MGRDRLETSKAEAIHALPVQDKTPVGQDRGGHSGRRPGRPFCQGHDPMARHVARLGPYLP